MKYLLPILLLSCNTKSNNKNIPVEKIIIKIGRSYQIDLDKQTYTVYFMNGSTYDCKFTLTDTDKIEISKIAQQCQLASLKDTIEIKDYCMISPKVMTQLSFYAGNNPVQVAVDESCDPGAGNIRKFLKFIEEKILAKPEVAKAPHTDIHYM